MSEHESHLTGMFFSNGLPTQLVKIKLVMNGGLINIHIYIYIFYYICTYVQVCMYIYIYLITKVSQEESGQV